MSKTDTAVDIDGNKFTVQTSILKWRPSAYAIVLKDNSVLLLKQKTGYDLPGGGIELGESLEEAVKREAKEETGLDVVNPRLLDVKSAFFKMPRSEDEFIHSLLYYYECEFKGGEISNDGFDEWEKEYALSAEWYPLDKLSGLHVASSVDFREIIKKAAASK